MQKNIIVGRNLLETITSALYENPIILFREYVQNSLDAYNQSTKIDGLAKLPDFCVHINIDKEHHKIVIHDNGYGIHTLDKFEKEMLSFGNSEKEDRTQFIGFRGIGRVSALPFCNKLVFRNKRRNADQIDICIWQGEDYKTILNDDSTDVNTFQDMIRRIVTITSEQCDISDDHYFEVIIEGYGLEIEEIIETPNFEQSLRMLLPLKYDDNFSAARQIEEKYKEFMNEDLTDFMCSILLDGKELKKNYSDNNILESGVIFWPIREKSSGKNKPGDQIGLLWFTFNKHMKSSKDKGASEYGIIVRSKNVQMGDNDTFADLCSTSKEYVGTYSELTATLRGVYGEFLINSPNLKDNARREWFKTDEYSIYIKYIVVDFMKRLYKYRYAASQYYRLKSENNSEQKKSSLKSALVELVDIENNKIDVSSFVGNVSTEIGTSNKETEYEANYSSEDIPRQSQTKRKNYDELMKAVEEFFVKEKQFEIFAKLRAYLKNYFNN